MSGNISQRAADILRLIIGTFIIIGVVVIALVVAGSIAAPQETTYSNDHFTVAESSDGESVLVTYEVETGLSDATELAERRDRMNDMSLVSACANERLDTYIEFNTQDEVENGNLDELVASCETGDVSLGNVTVSKSVK